MIMDNGKLETITLLNLTNMPEPSLKIFEMASSTGLSR
jgi:hypothetical protein